MFFQRATDRPTLAPFVQLFGLLYVLATFGVFKGVETFTGGFGPDARVHAGALVLAGAAAVLVACHRMCRESLVVWATNQVADLERELRLDLTPRGRAALVRAFRLVFPNPEGHWVIASTDGTRYLAQVETTRCLMRPFEFSDTSVGADA